MSIKRIYVYLKSSLFKQVEKLEKKMQSILEIDGRITEVLESKNATELRRVIGVLLVIKLLVNAANFL